MGADLIFGLLKVSAEIFQDERKDRFLKKAIRLEREWNEEMDKHPSIRSDLALDTIMREYKLLGALIIAESSKR